MMLRIVSGPAAAQPPRRHSCAGSKLGWPISSWNSVSLPGGQRAAFPRHHAERGAGLERRQRDQAGAGDQRDQQRERRAGDVEERPAVEVAVVRRGCPCAGPTAQALRSMLSWVSITRLRIGGGAGGELDEQEVARPHLRGERHRARRPARRRRARGMRRSSIAAFGIVAADHDHMVQQRQRAAGQRVVDRGLGRAQERQEVDVRESGRR